MQVSHSPTPINIKDFVLELGVIHDSCLKFHHVTSTVQKVGDVVLKVKSSVHCDEPFLILPFTAHICPVLNYSFSLWNSWYAEDLQLLQSVQIPD